MKYTMSEAALAARRAAGLKRISRVPFTCAVCRQTVMMARARARTARYCSRTCYESVMGRRGPAHPNWTGGRQHTSTGYIRTQAHGHPRADAKGLVPEHVLVAERALGRVLPETAVVHHVNGDKGDNRPVNLVICENQAYHLRLHAIARLVAAGGRYGHDKLFGSCGLVKPLALFYRGIEWDGRRANCIPCIARNAHQRRTA